jgi:hypothetical protein
MPMKRRARMVTKESRLYSSFPNAVAEVVTRQKDGWVIDWEDPPGMVGFMYEVRYIFQGDPPVKKSRAEILADARAAKAAKKVSE